MNTFKELNNSEKARVIKLLVGMGFRSLLDILLFYDDYQRNGGDMGQVGRPRPKQEEKRMTIRDWLAGRKGDNINKGVRNNVLYVDTGNKPYIKGSVAGLNPLPWVPSVDPVTGQPNPRPATFRYGDDGQLYTDPGSDFVPRKPMSQDEIVDFFWLMENPNNVGLNKDNGMYYKYRDPNGKDWDVGPGLVIGSAIDDKPYYTKEELDRAAYRYHMDAMDKLAPLYDEKYGSGTFGNIDDRNKLVVSDVMYRVGLNGVNPSTWPKMFDAINENNTADILYHSRSKFKDKKGVLNYDNARVKRLGEYLYPGMFEYLFRNSYDPNLRIKLASQKSGGGYLSHTGPEYPPVVLKVNRSKADFVQRLKDPNRAYIQDWDNPDNIATHKLSWADDGIVYPLVLNVNGRLVDFSRPPYDIWAGYDNAVRNGDTIHMTPLEAEWFTTHYKDYYPGFDEYKKGGSIHIKPENRGKFTALKKRTGHSATWFKKHGTPALRKMATFALNARKWNHKHPDGGSLFDRWRQYMQNNTIDVPMTFNLPEVQVTAQAPRPGDANYDKYIANTYDAWQRGDIDINTLPTETRNRVRGYSGTIAALKGMNTAAKVAGITAAIPLGIIAGVTGGIQLAPYIASAAETAGNSTLGQQIYHGLNAMAPGTSEWLLLPTWLKIGTAAADIGFTGYNVNEFRKNPNIENGIGAILGSLPYLIPAGKEVYDLATYRKIPEYLNRIKTNQKQFSEYNIANRKAANRILPMIDDIKSRRKLATSTRKLDYIDLQLDIDGNIIKTDFAYDPGVIKINSDVPYDEWSGMHEFGHHVDYTFGLPSQDIQLLSNYNYYNRDPRVHYLNNQYPGIEQEKTEQFADMFANTFSNKRPFDFNTNENVMNRILATENHNLSNWNLMSSANHNNLKDELFPKGARLREEFNNNFPVLIKPLAEGADIEKQLSKTGTISRNSLDTYIKKQGKFYQDVMNDVLNSDFSSTDKINYNDFKNAVSKKLPLYKRVLLTEYLAYGVDNLGYDVKWLEYVRRIQKSDNTNDKQYYLTIYGNLLKAKQAKSLLDKLNRNKISKEDFDNQINLLFDDFINDLNKDPYIQLNTFTFESDNIVGNTKHYLGEPIGHSRTYTTKDEPDILHVMESQSDWALGYEAPRVSEKGLETHYDRIKRLNREILDNEEKLKKGIAPDGHKLEYDYEIQLVKDIIQRDKDRLKELLSTLDQINNPNLYKNMTENYQSRLILENLRYATEQGLSKMRYPTRETAAKIEGYDSNELLLYGLKYFDNNGNEINPIDAVELNSAGSYRLSNLKNLKKDYEKWLKELESAENPSFKDIEVVNEALFDIDNLINELYINPKYSLPKTGIVAKMKYIDQIETILKKYSDFPKQYRKLFKDADVRTITDSKGNTWYEVDVPEKYQKGKAEILMNLAPYIGLGLSFAALNKKKALGGPIKPFSYLPIPEVRY